MWTENVYSQGDTMQMKNLAEIGIDVENYELDMLFADTVMEKDDLIRERIEHIDVVIERLRCEKSAWEEILRGKLYELLEE